MFAAMLPIPGVPVSPFSTPTVPANSHPPTSTLSKPPTPVCSSPEPDSDVYSYSIDEETRRQAAILRHTGTTSTLNQSSKWSSFGTQDRPMNPLMQCGDGICSVMRYTDNGVSLDDGFIPSRGAPRLLGRTKTLLSLRTPGTESSSTPPVSLHKKPSHLCLPKTEDDSTFSAAASSSSPLSRKPSLFSLRAWPSKNSVRSSEGSSDNQFSRCSSPIPPVSQEKPLLALSSPSASPMSDLDSTPKPAASPSPPKFRIRRKPVPQYFPDPSVDTDSSSSADSSGSEDANEASGALQIVGPNVFIAYDDDESTLALAPAFTHVIRLVPACKRSQALPNVSFSPETAIHTLHLHIPPPLAPPHPSSDFCVIDESYGHIQHGSSLLRNHHLVQSLPESILGSDGDVSTIQLQSSCFSGDSCAETLHKNHSVSYTDLVATQEFLASSGRFVALPELAHFLSDGPAKPPPLGLQLIHIDLVLSFLRPHPFAPTARRRVLLLTPRGQLALEGLALMACYLARVEGCSLRFALCKFEGSVGTVNKSWRGLLGNDGVVATYLENLLLA